MLGVEADLHGPTGPSPYGRLAAAPDAKVDAARGRTLPGVVGPEVAPVLATTAAASAEVEGLGLDVVVGPKANPMRLVPSGQALLSLHAGRDEGLEVVEAGTGRVLGELHDGGRRTGRA